MTEYSENQGREVANNEVIHQAVTALDGYGSERLKDASRNLGRDATHEFALPERRLSVVGVEHTKNPDSQVVKNIRKDMRACLESIKNPRQVEFMIEGDSNIDTDEAVRRVEGISTIEDAVRKHGESGVVLWAVADYKKRGVDVKISSPEKPEGEILQVVKQEGFSSEEIASYLTLRQLTSEMGGNRLQADRETTLHNMSRTFFDFQRKSGVEWIKDVRSVEEITQMNPSEMKAYQAVITQEFINGMNGWLKESGMTQGDVLSFDALLDHDQASVSMKDINELSDPLDDQARGSKINQVAARWNDERDKYLVEQIGKSMAAGKKPYVIYGSAHTLHIEPALRKLEAIQ